MNTHCPVFALLAAGLLAGAASAQVEVVKAYGENVANAGDLTGRSVCILGDVDGDGLDDWIVGAPGATSGAGTAYVLTGGYYSNPIATLHGAAGDAAGTVVASAGDIDHDGRADYIFTAPGSDNLFPFFTQDVGRVRVYSGKTGTQLMAFGGTKVGARLGEAAAGGQDANRDSWPDILAGAPGWDVDPATSQATNEGYAALYSGKDGTLLASFTGTGATDALGSAVAFVGDLDADGYADYAIASPGHDYILGGPFPQIVTDGGRVDVYSGKTNTVLYFKQGGTGDFLGSSVCGAGDTDGDGVPEVLVGAPGHNGNNGIAYLYEGATGALIHTFTGPGLVVPEHFGTAVAPVGDVNKDGHADVAIGAPSGTSSVYGGYTVVYSGKDYSEYVQPLNSSYGGDQAGLALSPATGDLNGDGWDDLLTSWPYTDYDGPDSGLALGLAFLTLQPDLGYQGPGNATMSMYGTPLFTGGQADMKLVGAALNSPAFLLASASQGLANFKGGVLVPNAAVSLLLTFATDAQGQVLIKGVPGGGGNAILYAQFLIKNAAYPKNWGLSNALAIELQP